MIDLSNRLRPKEAAAKLRVSLSCLAKWRMQKKGPPYHRLGERIVFYLPDELQAWVTSCAPAPGNPGSGDN